ncbi:MAG TPA: zf-HC2 domain-containing protein [Thermoanaerobaculia bacterium]|nr:zf-HC2 domain-containing protein [Thermoanaerobaculia bacterium]
MTAATDMECPSSEMLAAYLDNRLGPADRATVIEHLASCGECRSKMIDASDIVQVESNVKPFPMSKWIISTIAATVVIGLLVPPIKSMLDEPGIPELVASSHERRYRSTYGRLAGGFPYKPTGIVRSEDQPSNSFDEQRHLLKHADEIQNGNDLHTKGVLAMLLGNHDEAVPALRKAIVQNPEERDAIEQDLAVALLQSSGEGNLDESLEISNRLWAKNKTPEVAWNRAYALDLLGRDREAIAAWNEYLKLDSTSEWVQEATTQRDQLREALKP